MAFTGTVTINNSPWRDTDVLIFTREQASPWAQLGDVPAPRSAPVLTVPVTTSGTFTFAATAGAASKTINPAGANNSMSYTAKTAGVAGNSITVAYVDPAGNDQVLAIAGTGSVITVNLATGPAGAITSTAAQIKTAIEGDTRANALVTVANAGGDSGAGVVTAIAATALTNGYAALNGEYMAAGLDPSSAWRYREFGVRV